MAQHFLQNHSFALGGCLMPRHWKWNHPKQHSHTRDDCVSSEIGLVHRPQYHTGLFLIAATTSIITSHASVVQYFLQLSRHTFSSMQAVGTFSGLTSTSSSSTILFSMIAAVAMSLGTNQNNIAVWGKCYKLSLWDSSSCSFESSWVSLCKLHWMRLLEFG